MGFPIGVPLEPSPYLQAFSRYLAPNISGSWPWRFGVTWRHWSCDHLIPHIAFPVVIPLYPTLSPAVFETFGPKHIGVTTLTYQGHVTSSITWRFDSPYGVSYWCSIWTKSLSSSVFEIFGSKLPVQCKSSLRMRDITWPVPPMQNLGTYLNFPPHIAYSLWHFYWAPMKNRGCLLVRPPMLNAKSSEIFLSPDQNLANFGGFGGLGVMGFKKLRFLPPKGTSLRETTSFEPFCVKIGREVWPPGRLMKKNKKVTEAPIGKTCRR